MTGERAPAIRPAGYFCLRAPLLAFREFVEWSDLARSDAAELSRPRRGLRELLRRPEIREALFLASPALDDAIGAWEEDAASDQGRRAERTLIKYFARMAARSTPFGLFAAVATGTVGSSTRLVIPDRSRLQRHTRMDNEVLFTAARELTARPEARGVLRYFPNDSLALGAGRGHYAETRPGKEGHTFHLVSVDLTDALRHTLARAEHGATRDLLVQGLVNEETTRDEALQFVNELIDVQLLVPEVDLRVTGPEPGEALAAELERLPGAEAAAAALRQVDAALRVLDQAGLGVAPGRYRELALALAPLPGRIELSRLFQVDLVRPEAGTLGQPLVDTMRQGVELLRRITPLPGDDDLARFRREFQARYETREVPLLEALDQEIGIAASLWPAGDPSPLLRDLPLARPAPGQVVWQERERFLLHRLGELARSGADEWELSPEDLERLATPEPQPLPASFAVLAAVAAASGEAIARGDFQVHLHGIDSPGTRMLGRFCHADPGLAAQVRAQHQAEEGFDPDAIFAELVHLPAGRMGNVLLRPLLRQYEVTYLGASGAPRERQIPASDLRVRVVEGRIELWSHRLGRRVVPRLCSAHNFQQALLPYRFLGQLQAQGAAAPGWRWGPLGASAFLPRVRHGRVILALAMWRLDQAQLRPLTRGPREQRLAALAAWRAAHRVPRWVMLTDGDHQLPTDLDNPLMADCLLHELTGQPEARLQELWPPADRLPAEGPEGRFTHELIVPFLAGVPAAGVRPAPPPASGGRRACPGGEWLYLKLYAAPSAMDELLRECIGAWSHAWLEQGAVDRWFFLRFADPEVHLRWRLHGPAGALAAARAELEAELARRADAGQLWRVQLDTYEREVERYGGPAGVELAERLFHADSEAVLELLDLVEPGDAGLEERWRLGLFAADRWLAAFGLDIPARLHQLDESRGYGSVPRPDPSLRRQLSERFRAARMELDRLLDWRGDEEHPLAPGLELISDLVAAAQPVIAEYRRLAVTGTLTGPLGSIAGSVVHMHLNRLLRDSANAHETVLYDFLHRLYQARAARGGTG